MGGVQILFAVLWREIWQVMAVAASSGLFASVVVYTQITNWAAVDSANNLVLSQNFRTDPSTTLGIVRVLQGLLAAISSFALIRSFTYIYWILISRQNGLSYLSFLALAPSTLTLGKFEIILSSASRLSTRVMAFSSIVLSLFVWLSGLVLFLKTSMVVVYDTTHSYDVTAGTGPFNAAYVDEMMDFLDSSDAGYEHRVLPYSYYSVVYNLVTNPVFSTAQPPIQCDHPLCLSYLLTGGVVMTAPWQPTGYPQYPLIKVPNLPAMQVEFDPFSSAENYTDVDCDVFGHDLYKVSVRLCLSRPENDPGSIEAGLFVCNEGGAGGFCNTTYPTANITTRMSFFRRRATIVASRSNSSIMSVSAQTAPQKISISDDELSAYRAALSWLLDYSAADIPAPSAIIESFWSGRDTLSTEHITYGYLAEKFHSILAFPLWLFNANNWGNPDLRRDELVTTLPPEFYTQAHIVAPYTRIQFNENMLVLFAVFQGWVIVFAWVMLFCALYYADALPEISSFPLFDIAFKAEADNHAAQGDAWNAADLETLKMMKAATIHRKTV